MLYEGTGQYGGSTLRRVDLETGSVLKQIGLDDKLFGEGVAVWKDRLIQLTWQSGMGLVYDKKNLTLIREFGYLTEGWGITSDGKSLIMSDGTNTLHFLDAETFEEQGQIECHGQWRACARSQRTGVHQRTRSMPTCGRLTG